MNHFSLLSYLAAAVAGVIGFAVFFHERRSKSHLVFMAGMFALAVESIFFACASDSLDREHILFWQNNYLAAMAVIPGLWLLFSLTYARGNALDFLARWKVAIVAVFLIPTGFVLAFQGQLLDVLTDPKTPGQIVLGLRNSAVTLIVIGLLTSILTLMNLERTFRSAVGTMRWRIKFMVLGLGVLFAVRAYTASQFLLFHSLDPSMQALNSGVLLLGSLLTLRSLMRAGHFDVSVYPSHSVITNSFTAIVSGIYLLVVGLLAKAVSMFGGSGSAGFSTLKAFLVLICLVMLAIVLFSDRARLSTKQFISRHFQRPIYDYRTVWRTFTESTASRVEQPELCAAVVRLVSEIFQALSVNLWLVDERKDRFLFAGSSSLSASKAAGIELTPEEAAEIIRAVSASDGPLDIDASKEIWAAAARRLHPDDFHKGGNRIFSPLIAGGELLGLLTLGDRVGGLPFSVQDMDLLKSVSDQSAANFLNIQLSQRLSHAKQLEAFQAMSAFFVHDLKNTASTLSLMLQNLPVHYQDPKFREDALRGIGKTIDHINSLISRLGVLRHELAVRPVECDLNDLVREFLRSQSPPSQVTVETELRPLPKLRLDPEQMQKVLTNLLINATEAVAVNGHIRIETTRRRDWAILAVTDDGCGISREFLEKHLFRPFQTTKRRGIGIGMFHCKMIVEAHHGRIEVESTQGKGTSFQVLLPISSVTN